jgi:hypothetical protein
MSVYPACRRYCYRCRQLKMFGVSDERDPNLWRCDRCNRRLIEWRERHRERSKKKIWSPPNPKILSARAARLLYWLSKIQRFRKKPVIFLHPFLARKLNCSKASLYRARFELMHRGLVAVTRSERVRCQRGTTYAQLPSKVRVKGIRCGRPKAASDSKVGSSPLGFRSVSVSETHGWEEDQESRHMWGPGVTRRSRL